MLNYSMNSTTVNIMTLTGNGQVTAVPDIAILRLGVQTTGQNLADIQNENARASQAVLQSLEQLNIADIKTFQYSIDKLYDYEDNKRIDKGYSVRNIFEIRTTNMDQVGNLIDTAVYYGANVVDLIDFEVSDSNAYYMQALDLAIDNAYQKATNIAQNFGLTINPVPIRINENTTSPIPFQNLLARESAVSTPIEPGSKQIEASVTVQFLY